MQTLLLLKNNEYYIFWVCVCSLRHPACNAHAPYYIVICGLSGCTIFSTLSRKGKIFGRKLLNLKLDSFFLQVSSTTFLILRRIGRAVTTNVYWSSCTPYSCQMLMTWIFSKDFRKNIQISNFMEIRPVGAMLFGSMEGRTSRHEEADSRFPQFFPNKAKNWIFKSSARLRLFNCLDISVVSK